MGCSYGRARYLPDWDQAMLHSRQHPSELSWLGIPKSWGEILCIRLAPGTLGVPRHNRYPPSAYSSTSSDVGARLSPNEQRDLQGEARIKEGGGE